MVTRIHEVESLHELDQLFASGPTSAGTWRLQGLDLRGYVEAFGTLDVRGLVVLGGRLDPEHAEDLRRRGALVFPAVPEVPFDPYRGALYSPEELYAGLGTSDGSYEETPDARIYAWSLQHRHDLAATLATALHDQAVDDALTELAAGRRVIGVMGGHAVTRASDDYRAAARLGRSLAARGWTVATGGGPGAMEAANLGARSAESEVADLDRALSAVATAPDFRPSVTRWARAARIAADFLSPGPVTVGIPTWFYGHEPSNVFATHVAKYFRNALREDTLLRLCDGGVVFLPGAAGTVQEVFQDACENYYADAADRAPMVLVGRRHWTEDLPAWQLLSALGERRGLGDLLHLVDSVEEAAEVLGRA